MNHTTNADAPARLNANQITDDALDALYDERDHHLNAAADAEQKIIDMGGHQLVAEELAAAIRVLAEEFAAGPRTVDACAVRERLLALVTSRTEHVEGPPDYCPACRLLPAAQVPAILCPGPAKEQP